MLELRPKFGVGMITAFIRIEGRPVGRGRQQPASSGGAIDTDGADKAARFMQLLRRLRHPDARSSDTPGIMVGPEVEQTALVRHCARMFVVGANLTVPFFSVVLRKAYGLGALAMAARSHWRRSSRSPGRPASSPAWASRAR